MYIVAIQRDFTAQHYLIGGDWGPENNLHSHQYRVEVQLAGRLLDEHGYLIDIVDLEAGLEEILAGFRERTLNDLAEFEGLNPSIEHFARILHQKLSGRIQTSQLEGITVRVWENQIAWASYRSGPEVD